ncbi:unnamed protein product [Candidula unifasciata]|uniref:Uncharacterized protein n=1 Tax=Candidula unifasciata TaxID=100452 RepID=A0A8S3ZHF8_9EUPU|nr:unnamed protein product [Candidula unifasciata]
MGKKKGRTGQKKLQGPKAKAVQKAKNHKKAESKSKAKSRKTQSKAVKTNLKKMSFDNSKKIDLLNADITKVLMAPPKLAPVTSDKVPQKKPQVEDVPIPDVASIEQQMEQM